MNIIDFFRMLNIFSPELHPLLVYFYSPRTSMISVFLFRKKTYSKFKVYCKQNRHFYRDFFFRDSRFFLTSSLYRSMWTIGRSQRVEEKKYRLIVRKLRYITYNDINCIDGVMVSILTS